MRKILFRGKSPVVNDWVYGYYVKTQVDKKEVHTIIPFEELTKTLTEKRWFEVAPSTVGQFTGLTDKNGTKIFDGDIIQYSIEEDQAVFIGAVKFGEFNPDGGALIATNVGFYVELVDLEGKRTYMRKDIGYWVKFRGIEVIGNIHDNPELLEGKE